MASRRAILGGILASPFAARQAAAEAARKAVLQTSFSPSILGNPVPGQPPGGHWWGTTPTGQILLRRRQTLDQRLELARQAIAETPSWSPAYRRIKMLEAADRIAEERSTLEKLIDEFIDHHERERNT